MSMLEHEGPTPAGGVRTETFLLDEHGTPTDDLEAAVALEVVEYDAAGEELARTYGRTDLPPIVGTTNADDEHHDAPKGGTWDVTISIGGKVKPVESLDELRALLEADIMGEPMFRRSVADLLTLPMWDRAPARLAREVYTYLESTRPNTR